jgi:lipopolysaccharide/colanic/teichoic acid biosynthesis glycosyltransferase
MPGAEVATSPPAADLARAGVSVVPMPWSKRLTDLAGSLLGLVVMGPVLALFCLLIWLEDRHWPLYVAPRIGLGGRPFRMVKLRSMRPDADKMGVDSTAKSDPRITRVGRVIRRLKLDEFSQLWDVFTGDMSLVGPRPNVARDVALYTPVEWGLLSVRPGITDFASIVFADEGDILEGASDPDLKYNQVIRPWKSRLGLHYIACRTWWLDVRLILATLLNALSRRAALNWVVRLLEETGAAEDLIRVARRQSPLEPAPPPGATEIVQSRRAIT